ncbi:MAG: LytTR family DNA-binding domain-containing protein [Sediminibacterium sp.]|nr:LytTR family DNA-binding domain-containing protein [Sediminibacterium sp.]
MKIYSCIIIDDEPGAHRVLENYISRVPGLFCTDRFFNALDAYRFLEMNTVDFIFLDINMPELDGLTFIKLFSTPPKIIITSAYSDYAVNGFDLDVCDYLLKPIRFERFLKAIAKVKQSLSVSSHSDKRTGNDVIEVRANGQSHTVRIDDIYYIQSIGNYVKLCLKGKNLLVHSTTGEMEAKLKGSSLIRVHKSYIVNVMYVTAFSDMLLSVKDSTIPVGKTFKRYIIDALSCQENTDRHQA